MRSLLSFILALLILLVLIFLLWWYFRPPEANDDTYEAQVGVALVENVLTNDNGRGQLLTLTVSPAPAVTLGVLNQYMEDGSFTYVPGSVGTETFIYQVCNGRNRCDEATVTINNAPPIVTAEDDTFNGRLGEPVTGNVLSNDMPAGGATAVKTSDPTPSEVGTVALDANGEMTFTPTAAGTATFGYQACLVSDSAICNDATVTVTITDGVSAVDDSFGAEVGQEVTGNVLDNDLPAGELTAEKTTDPTSGTATVDADGSMVYTPTDAAFEGTDSFEYEACLATDSAQCDTAVVTINIPPPDEVFAHDDTFAGAIDETITGNVLANDKPAADQLLAAKTSDPATGTATIDPDGALTYTPTAGFEGTETLTYEACSKSNADDCDTATVTITIPVPPPTAVDDAYMVDSGEELEGNILENDLPENLTLTVKDPGSITVANGTIDVAEDGSFTYTSNDGYTGKETFTYRACVTAANCSDATATVTIEVKEPPITGDLHTVVKGEWLIQIARCYGTTPEAIRHANYIPYPDLIYPGQVLKIPNAGSVGSIQGPPCIETYTVKAGDTVTRIAAAYGITVSEFARVNDLYVYYGYYHGYHYHRYIRPIYAGEVLIVPRPIPDYMQPAP